MIWKESLKIGVERIDSQHKELFTRVNSFLKVVLGNAKEDEKNKKIWETLIFLSGYVVLHFKAEEQIQKKNNYPGYKEHCKIHAGFVNELNDFKKKFLKSDFDKSVIYKFSGKILSWLINHVANEDQKIGSYLTNISATGKKRDISKGDISNGYIDLIIESIKTVVFTMLDVEVEKGLELLILEEEYVKSEIRILININGDVEGKILYSFSNDITLKILEKMSGIKRDKSDDFVISAISELIDIITANTVGNLNKLGYFCNITPPQVLIGKTRDEILKGEKILDTIVSSEIGTFDFRYDFQEKK